MPVAELHWKLLGRQSGIAMFCAFLLEAKFPDFQSIKHLSLDVIVSNLLPLWIKAIHSCADSFFCLGTTHELHQPSSYPISTSNKVIIFGMWEQKKYCKYLGFLMLNTVIILVTYYSTCSCEQKNSKNKKKQLYSDKYWNKLLSHFTFPFSATFYSRNVPCLSNNAWFKENRSMHNKETYTHVYMPI